MDFAVARHNMVESQIRPAGITDGRIIAAFAQVPRQDFVPDGLRDTAYMGEDISLGNAQGQSADSRWLMDPLDFARLIQPAAIGPLDYVLDIGCASGYSTAILAHLAQSVVGIDENEAFIASAIQNLDKLDITNAAVFTGQHRAGYASQAPFDVIVINGRVPEIPHGLAAQLKDGGRIVAVTGDSVVARTCLMIRHGETLSQRRGYDAMVQALPGFEADQAGFVF